jgi:hypothetical protein
MDEDTTARNWTDEEINRYAVYLPYAPAGDGDAEALPCIVLGGDADGQGGVQVYAYARDGQLIISADFGTAGPGGDGRRPWAYYGPDGQQVPVILEMAGDPDPAWQATADVNPGAQGMPVAGQEAPAVPQEPVIWNTVVRVIARISAVTGPKAIVQLANALIRAGFDPIDGPGYCEAKALGVHSWQVTQAVVANRLAPYGMRARNELDLALNQAGFLTAPQVQRGDWFAAEDGTEVTELPAESALRRAGERDSQEQPPAGNQR